MRITLAGLGAALAILSTSGVASAAPDLMGTKGLTEPLKILALLTVLSLLPAIILSTTSFIRCVVVLGFVRTGIGAAQTPPNQVLIGIALFMTVFTMAPVTERIVDEAYTPYVAEKIDEAEAFERATVPIRAFMLRQTRKADLALFYQAADMELPQTEEEVPLRIAMPAFVISELTTSFQMGVLVLLPFLLIDLATASVLMSMGMMMVPPTSISLPLKLLLFVVVDGWHLLTESLLRSFM